MFANVCCKGLFIIFTHPFSLPVFRYGINSQKRQMQKDSIINKINYFLIVLISSFFCICGYQLKAQLSYKVLFLGNSYTSVNNLPQLVHDVALSAGDTLVFDSYAPGGYTLEAHSLDVTSQNKIMAGGWDYVVMQGQSQEPIMANNQFTTGAGALYQMIKQYNPCAVTMPYMTWGRKNGDAANCPNFPLMCTYESMDAALRECYLALTANINGEVSPVSVVWHYLRQNYPNIELYQPDESHPSAAGSYAGACCFYAMLFKKDPTMITFNFGLNATDASIIRDAAKIQVFDSLLLWDFKKPPMAKIVYEIGTGTNEAIFHSAGLGFNETYLWDFGDWDTSSLPYSPHSYLTDGTYTVTLTTTNCDLQGLHTSFADTVIQFCSHTPTIYTSHPWVCKYDTLWTQPADSYQWFCGTALPETNQYLANYYQYNISGFSVLSTVNGCSELSGQFTDSPQWSGYYFDGIGDPCAGDTVAFAVLHQSGSLPGSETILWFKNDTLLPLMTNEDTLLISAEGKFQCKVIVPTSDCPLDTTSAVLEYNCDVVGIEESDREISWRIFPNPASETITIKFTKYSVQEEIQIYSVIGLLTRSIIASAPITKINIADFPDGLYYVRLKSNKQPPLKFIKL
jgi:PKD repeat protein